MPEVTRDVSKWRLADGRSPWPPSESPASQRSNGCALGPDSTCGSNAASSQPVVLFQQPAFRDNRPMGLPDNFYEPSPGPWTFHEHVYGLSHTLIDRDGRVLTTHV